MRQNNLTNWKYDSSLECLLFFAQRLDELLFHHTTDTYRYPSLSLRGLAIEYYNVYNDVKNGRINKKNLEHIIDEFSDRLDHDDIAKEILTAEFSSRFIKNYKKWNIKTQVENIQYIMRKLSNRTYYNHVVNNIKCLIRENKEKGTISTRASAFVRELLDCGYNENYVFQVLHEVFFHKEVSSLDSLDNFLSRFDFSPQKYDVFIGYSSDISSLLTLYDKMKFRDLNVSIVDPTSVPKGIKTKRQKTILKFEGIKSYDMYTAFEIANAISLCVANSYTFFRHDPKQMRTYGQVMDSQNNITTIRPSNLLKYRVSTLSHDASTKNAESLIKVLFLNPENLHKFFSITRVHNAAISSENTRDSLLSLWSALESIVNEDDNADEKQTVDGDNKERSKIGNVISYTIPYLKSTYIQKLVQTCMLDIIRWDAKFFNEHIANNGLGTNNLECTFAFLAFKSTKPDRDLLSKDTENYPLLRYRVYTLSNAFHNSKEIKSLIKAHTQRVTWHLYRIYRARNYIIHDANENNRFNEGLVLNLHSYVDALFSEVISQISTSPYNDSIYDAITNHKLSILIMDEKLENRAKEEITKNNALQYLYYDFER